MDYKGLYKFLSDQPKYRITQIKQLIFKDLISDWQSASTLSLELRKNLSDNFSLDIDAQFFHAKDKSSTKALVKLSDDFHIETVLMRFKDGRNTVCVSSQVGCPLGCKFCATGAQGFKRNLTAGEIIDQVLLFARLLKKEDKKITNIVYMGMGEPFINYDNVLASIKMLNEPDGFNLGARSFSISTSGIVPGIQKLANEKMQINLAISLHAANSALRSKIMPVNNSHDLSQVMEAVEDYIKKTNSRVMFEYLLIKDVNDSEQDARQLAKLMQNPLYFVNLIVYNATGTFEPSSREQVKKFENILKQEKIHFSRRFSFGSDIAAACGQLANI